MKIILVIFYILQHVSNMLILSVRCFIFSFPYLVFECVYDGTSQCAWWVPYWTTSVRRKGFQSIKVRTILAGRNIWRRPHEGLPLPSFLPPLSFHPYPTPLTPWKQRCPCCRVAWAPQENKEQGAPGPTH